MNLPSYSPSPEDWSHVSRRQQREQSRQAARMPKKMQRVLAQVMLRRGYGREQSSEQLDAAWKCAAGALAPQSRPGQIRRGVLEVLVSNSAVMQELAFQKRALIKTLSAHLPEQQLRDLRFRVGPVG